MDGFENGETGKNLPGNRLQFHTLVNATSERRRHTRAVESFLHEETDDFMRQLALLNQAAGDWQLETRAIVTRIETPIVDILV